MSRDDSDEDLARRLSALKFGARSRVRESLRARLLARGARPGGHAAGAWALAAAVVAAVFFTLPHRPRSVPPPAWLGAPQPGTALFAPVSPVEGPSPFRVVPVDRVIETRPLRIDELFVRPVFVKPL